MFEKKQLIYSESLGICRVDNIVSLSPKSGESLTYYALRSFFDKEKTAYIPVDRHEMVLRELFSVEEAQELLRDPDTKKDQNLLAAVTYVCSKAGIDVERADLLHEADKDT